METSNTPLRDINKNTSEEKIILNIYIHEGLLFVVITRCVP